MVFPVWIAGLFMSLVAAEVFVRIARWQISQPPPAKRSSPFQSASLSVGLSLPVQLISYAGLFITCLTLVKAPNALQILAVLLPLAGWCMCWSRGLERFVDQCYPNRSLVTMALRDASLNPITILLVGIYLLSPFHSVLEPVLLSAALLPLYFWFSVALTQRAYPAAKLDRTTLLSMAFRFAAGFLNLGLLFIGLLCWLCWTYIPSTRSPATSVGIGIGFHLLAYFAGTWYEIDLAQRLAKRAVFVEPETVVEVPPVTVTVQDEEEKQTLSQRR